MHVTSTRMFFRVLRITLLGVMLGSALGCGPQGEIVQNIQPPHQAYLDRQNPVKSNLTNLKEQSGEAGVPLGCTFTRASKTKLCLNCSQNDYLVTRCYASLSEIDFAQACQHTADTVKCLVNDPPFALSLNYRVSHEKFLRDNYLLWQQTIHSVWDEKLSGNDLNQLNDLLKFVDRSTLWLSKGASDAPQDEELKGALAFLGPDQDKGAKEARKFLQELQALRLDGKLKFSQVLSKSDAFLEKINASPKAREAMKSLNTHGLED